MPVYDFGDQLGIGMPVFTHCMYLRKGKLRLRSKCYYIESITYNTMNCISKFRYHKQLILKFSNVDTPKCTWGIRHGVDLVSFTSRVKISEIISLRKALMDEVIKQNNDPYSIWVDIKLTPAEVTYITYGDHPND